MNDVRNSKRTKFFIREGRGEEIKADSRRLQLSPQIFTKVLKSPRTGGNEFPPPSHLPLSFSCQFAFNPCTLGPEPTETLFGSSCHALRDAPKSPVLPAKSIWYAEDLGKDVIVSERDTYMFVIHCSIMQNVKLVSTV